MESADVSVVEVVGVCGELLCRDQYALTVLKVVRSNWYTSIFAFSSFSALYFAIFSFLRVAGSEGAETAETPLSKALLSDAERRS